MNPFLLAQQQLAQLAFPLQSPTQSSQQLYQPDLSEQLNSPLNSASTLTSFDFQVQAFQPDLVLQIPASSTSPQPQAPQQSSAKLSRHASSILSSLTSPNRMLTTITDFLHAFSLSGIIIYASPSSFHHISYTPEELVGTNIYNLIHPDDHSVIQSNIMLSQRGSESNVFYCRYKLKSGGYTTLELVLRPFMNQNSQNDSISILVTARELVKTDEITDSVLKLKLEKALLKQSLQDSRRISPTISSSFLGFNSDLTLNNPFDSQSLINQFRFDDPNFYSQNLGGYVGLTSGLAPVGMSAPAFSTPVNEDGKKKKKQKTDIDIFCHQCGTRTSPEWRRGPDGPKTLCNACGLAFSKKQKKLSASLAGGSPK